MDVGRMVATTVLPPGFSPLKVAARVSVMLLIAAARFSAAAVPVMLPDKLYVTCVSTPPWAIGSNLSNESDAALRTPIVDGPELPTVVVQLFTPQISAALADGEKADNTPAARPPMQAIFTRFILSIPRYQVGWPEHFQTSGIWL